MGRPRAIGESKEGVVDSVAGFFRRGVLKRECGGIIVSTVTTGDEVGKMVVVG